MFKYSIIILITAQILAAPFSSAELYMWTDKKGIKHISNAPPGKQVEKFKTFKDQSKIDVGSTVHKQKIPIPKAKLKVPTTPALKPAKPKIDHKVSKARPKITTPNAKLKVPTTPVLKPVKPKTDHKTKIVKKRQKDKEAWVKAYGPIAGKFEPGLTVKAISFFGITKRRITLSDGSVWVTGRRDYEGALGWQKGTKITLNRKDGIVYSNENPDLWVKVFPP